MKARFRVVLISFVALCLCNVVSAQQVSWMKLMTPQVGWAANIKHLNWTTDGGVHWNDVAPSMSRE